MQSSDTISIPVEADLSGFSRALGELQSQSVKFGSTFASSIRSAVVSGRSFEDTLRSMALKLSQVALSASLKPIEGFTARLVDGVAGSIGASFAGSARGDGIVPFAKGGVVSSPTFFGAGGTRGVMGEAGAEAIMPLARGGDGRLGVRVQNANQPVNVVFNVSSPDVEGFRKSQNQLSAMLARTVHRGRRSS